MNAAKIETCPVCSASQLQKLERIPVSDLIAEYRRQRGMEVAAEFAGSEALTLWRCEGCGLEFFDPPHAGSSTFYGDLAAESAYYVTGRWEFAFAQEYIRDTDAILDVGCGDGDFLAMTGGRVRDGIEFNEAAAERARDRGLSVRVAPLEAIGDAQYDVVTLFQVAEHLADPLSVGNQARRVLRPGGRLIIAVPDSDGMIGKTIHEPLNAPPHHPLRWNATSLRALAQALELDAQTVAHEPLPQEHQFNARRAWWTDRFEALRGARLPRYQRRWDAVWARRLANGATLLGNRMGWRALPRGASGHSVALVASLPNAGE